MSSERSSLLSSLAKTTSRRHLMAGQCRDDRLTLRATVSALIFSCTKTISPPCHRILTTCSTVDLEWMNDCSFLHCHSVSKFDPFFPHQADYTVCGDLSRLQKISMAMFLLAYGSCADQLDKMQRLAESTALEFLYLFSAAIIAQFSGKYLRTPNDGKTRTLLFRAEKLGFQGCCGP